MYYITQASIPVAYKCNIAASYFEGNTLDERYFNLFSYRFVTFAEHLTLS